MALRLKQDIKTEYYLERCGPIEDKIYIPLEGRELIFGREVCNSPHISRKHASFQQHDDGTWFVKDLKSLNGLFKNRKRIKPLCLQNLDVGNHISFGVPYCKSEVDFEFILSRNENFEDSKKNIPLVKADTDAECDTSQLLNQLPQSEETVLNRNAEKQPSILPLNDCKQEVEPKVKNETSSSIPSHSKTFVTIKNEVTEENTLSRAQVKQEDQNEPSISLPQNINTIFDTKKEISTTIVLPSPKTPRFSRLSRKRNDTKSTTGSEISLLPSFKRTETELDDDIIIIDPVKYKKPFIKSRYFQVAPTAEGAALPKTNQPIIDLESESTESNQIVINSNAKISNVPSRILPANQPKVCKLVQQKLNFPSRPELGNRNSLHVEISSTSIELTTGSEVSTSNAVNLIDSEFEKPYKSKLAQKKPGKSINDDSSNEVLQHKVIDCNSVKQSNNNGTVIEVTEFQPETKQSKELKTSPIKIIELESVRTQIKDFVKPDSTTCILPNDIVNLEVSSSGILDSESHIGHNEVRLSKVKAHNSVVELPSSTTDSEEDIHTSNHKSKFLIKKRNLQERLVKEAMTRKCFVLLEKLPKRMFPKATEVSRKKKLGSLKKVKVTRNRIISSSESEDDMEKSDFKVTENNFPSTSKIDLFDKMYNAHDDEEVDHMNYSQADDCILISDDDDDNANFKIPHLPMKLMKTAKIESLDHVSDVNGEVDLPDINEALKYDENDDTSDFFPVLSQAFYEDDDIAHAESNIDKPTTSSKRKKSVIQLTEALALTSKPKYLCGRGEWIKSNQKSEIETNQFYPKKRSLATKPALTTNETKSKPKKKFDIKAKLQADMGHRIPIPGGGSAIRPVAPNATARSKIASSRTITTVTQKPVATLVTATKRKLSNDDGLKANDVDKVNVAKTKKAKVTTSSRMDKMIETSEPTAKIRPNKSLSGFKIPKKHSSKDSDIVPLKKTLILESKPNAVNVPGQPGISQIISNGVKSNCLAVKVNKMTERVNFPFKETSARGTLTLATANHILNKRKIRFSDELHLNEQKQLLPKRVSLENSSSSNGPNLYSGLNHNQNAAKKSNLKVSGMSTKQLIKVDVVPTHKYTSDKFLAIILKWNVKWLEEQAKSSEPPPLIKSSKMYKQVKTHYDSVDEHFETYFPLLILETWELIYRDWNENKLNPRHFQPLFVATNYVSTNVLNANGDIFGETTLESVIEIEHLQDVSLFKEGMLIIFEQKISLANNPNVVKLANFAYIKELKCVQFNPRTNQNAMLSTIPAARSKMPQHITLLIKMRYQNNVQPKWNEFLTIKPITYIRPVIRQVESLISLDKSPLAKYILTPQRSVMEVNFFPQNLMAIGYFNKSQSNAILGAAYMGLRAKSVPKIILLQGPPGTGKTHTCVGLIQQLLYGQGIGGSEETPRRLLVLAPSNAAIDEIARRLIKLKEKIEQNYPTRKFSFVRVGQPDCMHSDVKEHAIDELAVKYCKLKERKQDHELTEQINILEAQVNSLNIKITRKLQNHQDVTKEELDINFLHSEINKLESRKKLLSNVAVDFRKKDPHTKQIIMSHKRAILMQSDVILTTLSSSRQTIIDNIFGPNSKHPQVKFTACIVDEASQCCEPELLLPLQYQISKLILIGDPQQLPATILSQKAASFNFQKSLFERFYNYFGNKESPIIMLHEQYRMHSEICSFPSEHFYNCSLYTSPNVDKAIISFPLKPCIMLDLEDSKETSNKFAANSFQNYSEVSIIIKLCEEIVKLVPSYCTIGVITPYQGQRKLFIKNIGNLARRIEFNTVDGFQGREKDITIMSCVRANDEQAIGFLKCPQRLNVAITRACKCSIICGHLDSLKKHQHWNRLIENAYSRNLVYKVNSKDALPKIMTYLKK